MEDFTLSTDTIREVLEGTAFLYAPIANICENTEFLKVKHFLFPNYVLHPSFFLSSVKQNREANFALEISCILKLKQKYFTINGDLIAVGKGT